ncbi:hypothetical protein G7Y89_g9039 [Cudoniella acicularis]|uniref:Uncharacterized protein n=1 Tax=Cudoniella acicularis TaxID=354080 RepID=A0A8H4W0G6_9HELO|nr:hypothetical protein G7Y89_g9039 [Cudoniella acicularis]
MAGIPLSPPYPPGKLDYGAFEQIPLEQLPRPVVAKEEPNMEWYKPNPKRKRRWFILSIVILAIAVIVFATFFGINTYKLQHQPTPQNITTTVTMTQTSTFSTSFWNTTTATVSTTVTPISYPCHNVADPDHNIGNYCTCDNGVSLPIASAIDKNTGTDYMPCPYTYWGPNDLLTTGSADNGVGGGFLDNTNVPPAGGPTPTPTPTPTLTSTPIPTSPPAAPPIAPPVTAAPTSHICIANGTEMTFTELPASSRSYVCINPDGSLTTLTGN